MKRYYLIPAFACFLLLITAGNISAGSAVSRASNSEGVYHVRDFGAAGDGTAMDTKAIQRAVDAAHNAAGGTVLFSPGTYLSGTIILKSNVTLHLAAGAVLLGSTDLKDFPVIEPAFRSYTDKYVRQSLIYGENIENVAITGRGVIDGRGAAFYGLDWLDRPYNIRIITSRHILIEGITLKNSPMWMQHYLACDFVTVRGIKVINNVNHNNDMIDIDCCRNVHISDCYSDTGDDGITIKTTADRICENVTVTNCVVRSECNGIKLGTESNGGFRNITVSNCVVNSHRERKGILGRLRGISGISLEMVDGGILEKITISNITVTGVDVPVFLRLGNRARPYKKDMERPGMGSFRDVIISNITGDAASKTGCSITGLPGHPIENVTVSNIRLTYPGGGTAEDAKRDVPENPGKYPEASMFGTLPAFGFYCRHVRGLTLDNIDIGVKNKDSRPAFLFDDVQGLKIRSCGMSKPNPGSPFCVFRNVSSALLTACTAPHDAAPCLYIGEGCSDISVIGNDLGNTRIPFEFGGANAGHGFFETANRMHGK